MDEKAAERPKERDTHPPIHPPTHLPVEMWTIRYLRPIMGAWVPLPLQGCVKGWVGGWVVEEEEKVGFSRWVGGWVGG